MNQYPLFTDPVSSILPPPCKYSRSVNPDSRFLLLKNDSPPEGRFLIFSDSFPDCVAFRGGLRFHDPSAALPLFFPGFVAGVLVRSGEPGARVDFSAYLYKNAPLFGLITRFVRYKYLSYEYLYYFMRNAQQTAGRAAVSRRFRSSLGSFVGALRGAVVY
jgi:hypothetical protein